MAQLVFLGKLADLVGASDLSLSLPGEASDTTALRRWLDETRTLDGLLLEPTVRIAVNSEIVNDPHPIQDTDEIAFMPPVGGG